MKTGTTTQRKHNAAADEDPESEGLEAYETEIVGLSDPDEQEAW